MSWAFVQFAAHPLSHTDLWGHLAYGRYYDEEGAFPDREPFLSTTVDSELVLTSWLCQWGGYRIHQVSGTVGLQIVYAVLVAGTIIAFSYLMKRQSRSWLLAILGPAWFVFLEQQQITTMRPQLVGIFCFILFLILANPRQKVTPGQSVALLGLMTFWVNMHGSFAIAPVILVLSSAGHVFDVARIHFRRGLMPARLVRYLLEDRYLKRSSILLGGIFVATLINPYGFRIWVEVLTFGKSPNLFDLIEWMPLWKTPKQGTVFLLSGFGLLAIYLVQRYRLRMELWLPVFALTVQLIRVSRYFVWWSPVLIKAVIPDWRIAERWKRKFRIYAAVERGLNYRIPGGVLVLVLFAGISISQTRWSEAMFEGASWTPRASYSASTPIEVSKPLMELEPQTLMFNTMEWGDYFIWKSRGKLPVFVNSHVHLIQEQVWRDYMSFIRQSEGWQERWDSYEFRVAVVQYRRHRELAQSLETDPEWVEIYSDREAKLFVYEPQSAATSISE